MDDILPRLRFDRVRFMKISLFFYEVYSYTKIKSTVAEKQPRYPKDTEIPPLTCCKIETSGDQGIDGKSATQQVSKEDSTQEQPGAQSSQIGIETAEPSIIDYLIRDENNNEMYMTQKHHEKDLSVSYVFSLSSFRTLSLFVLAWISMGT